MPGVRGDEGGGVTTPSKRRLSIARGGYLVRQLAQETPATAGRPSGGMADWLGVDMHEFTPNPRCMERGT